MTLPNHIKRVGYEMSSRRRRSRAHLLVKGAPFTLCGLPADDDFAADPGGLDDCKTCLLRLERMR